jgi:hypothetical protein
MAISAEERRFLRSWEEQRQGGKPAFIAQYALGYFIFFFMMAVVLGLFSGLRLVNINLVVYSALISAVASVVFAFVQWKRGQSRFSKIVRREAQNHSPEAAA